MTLRVASAVALLVAALLACAQPDDDGVRVGAETEDGPLEVVATMSIIGDLAADIGGEHVQVHTLVPIGGDPHGYEPSPSDAARIEDADVVLANGLGLEPWFEPLASRAGERLTIVTEGVGSLVVDDEDGEVDPHLWMVPTVVADGYVPAIRDSLLAVRPELGDEVADAADALIAQLQELDEELRDELAVIDEERRTLVTSHDAYSYFADHYDIEVLGSVFGVSTEREPSAREIAELVDAVRAADVPVVFAETTIDARLVERVARDAGVEVGDPLYGDSVGPPGSDAEDYAGMMRANARALVAGLGGR